MTYDVAAAVALVRGRIAAAARGAGREPAEVRLIAASKSVDLERIHAAWAAGVVDFAENYATELAAKAPALPRATWHFIGRLQRGTAARIARHAQLIHSAEPGDALRRVAARADREGRTIPVLVEVDFTGSRQGVAPEEVGAALEEIAGVRGVRTVGLMTIPPPMPDARGARRYFAALRELRDRARPAHPGVLELSMGMSVDYTVAVEEGATMVRIGRALFGPRPVPTPS